MRTIRLFMTAAVLLAAPAIADVVVPVDSVENYVNVRAEMDSESMVIGRLSQGSSMPHLGSEPGWHKVDLDGGASGFISADWARVVDDSPDRVETVTDIAEAESEAVSEAATVEPETVAEGLEAEAEPMAAIVDEVPDNSAFVEPDSPSLPNTAPQPEALVDEPATNSLPVETEMTQSLQGPMGPPGPPGPAGPPGIGGDGAGLKGAENYLVKFAKPTVGGSSQVFDDGRNIGIGTEQPKQRLEVNGSIQIHEQNSSVAGLMITQSSGETGYIMHNRASTLTIGAGSVDRVTIDRAGNVGIGQVEPEHPLEMASGAHVTAGGAWVNASSITKKENVESLSPDDALQALAALEPVLFNYKTDRGDQHVGFIAEHVPDLVASRDRTGLSSMDIVAVLTRVVQQQQRRIDDLERRLAE